MSGVIVIGSRWANKKSVPTTMVIGGVVAAFGVAIISEANAHLGLLFAALILAGVVLTDGVAFFKKLGLK
jgi:hypothetical protein